MRKFFAIVIALSLLLTWIGAAQSGDESGLAVIKKAIAAAGGEAKLAKYQSATFKEKGTYYGQGKGLDYTGVYTVKWPTHFKMEIQGVFTIALAGDKGWVNGEKGIQDLPKDQLDVEIHNTKAGWMTTLLPLTDKAFTLKVADAGKNHSAVEVTRTDYPTMRLYFDKKTGLLVKSEFKTKAAEQKFKEVLQEVTYSDFKTVDGCVFPHHMVIKHDGKLFVETDVTDMKAATFDAKAFAKPSSN
jgi:outer membrane lipoprotein-sorting protein